MPTVIDALVVTLGLDPKNFTTGQKEAMASLKRTEEETEKRSKNIEAKAKIAAGGFKAMRNELLGMVGAFASVAGTKRFVDTITAGDIAVGNLAKNLKISTEELSAWQQVSEKMGGTSAGMDSAFRNINKIIQDLRTVGHTDAETPLNMLLGGAGYSKFIAASTTMAERIRMIQSAIANATNHQDALTWAQKAGFTEENVNVFAAMGQQTEALIAAQIRLNAVTKQNVEDARQLKAGITDLGNAFEKLGRQMLTASQPAIQATVKGATSLLGYIGNSSPERSLGTDLYDALQGNNQLGDYKGRGSTQTPDPLSWFHTNSGRSRSPGLPSRKVSGRVTSESSGDDFAKTSLGQTIHAWAESQRMPSAHAAEVAQAETDLRSYADGRRLMDMARRSRSHGASSNSQVTINTLNVNTKATDAPGIARDIRGALNSPHSMTTQANQGLR